MNNIIIITSYRPDYQLIHLADGLFNLGFDNLIIADDGSGAGYSEIYSLLSSKGAHIIRHETNTGKGASVKDALTYVIKSFPDAGGVVIADGDGQHLPSDIKKISDRLSEAGDAIVLGVRNLKSKAVPLSVRNRNRFSSLMYHMDTGKRLADSQTGLRGIPHRLIPFAASVSGSRFEYEANLLKEASLRSIPFITVGITTVFPKGNTSYYRPVADTARFFKATFKFFTSSFSCSVLDIILFTVFSAVFAQRAAHSIFAATILARIISGTVNFTLNRRFIFSNNGRIKKQLTKFFTFFVIQMLLSSSLVSLFSVVPLPLAIIKALVDIGLFFLNYTVQKRWIFR